VCQATLQTLDMGEKAYVLLGVFVTFFIHAHGSPWPRGSISVWANLDFWPKACPKDSGGAALARSISAFFRLLRLPDLGGFTQKKLNIPPSKSDQASPRKVRFEDPRGPQVTKGRPKAAQGRPRSTKGRPRATKGRPKATKGRPRATKWGPKGDQREQKALVLLCFLDFGWQNH